MTEESKETRRKDPVCYMTITPQTTVAEVTHRGRTYYFCSNECRKKFEAEPEKYGG